MTCECGHIKAEHEFNGKFCFLCSCTKYRNQTKNESTPDLLNSIRTDFACFRSRESMYY